MMIWQLQRGVWKIFKVRILFSYPFQSQICQTFAAESIFSPFFTISPLFYLLWL